MGAKKKQSSPCQGINFDTIANDYMAEYIKAAFRALIRTAMDANMDA